MHFSLISNLSKSRWVFRTKMIFWTNYEFLCTFALSIASQLVIFKSKMMFLLIEEHFEGHTDKKQRPRKKEMRKKSIMIRT